MVIATVAACVGVLLGGISMLQGTGDTLRMISEWGLIVLAVVFAWSFLSLGRTNKG